MTAGSGWPGVPPIVPPSFDPDPRWTRRRFLKTGLVVAAGAATVGVAGWLGSGGAPTATRPAQSPLDARRSPAADVEGLPSPAATASPPPVRRHYRSRPDLSAPVIDVARRIASTAPGLIFLTPNNGLAPDGPLIVDDAGEPVWIRPDGKQSATNLRVSTYRGQPVISWWEGTVNGGLGDGDYVIADAAYREIARVKGGDGLNGDLHEFLITPAGTALLLAGGQVAAPIAASASPPPWPVWDCVAQEIDIATGLVQFAWHTVDHVDLAETLATPPTDGGAVFDYVHANSIDVDHDGHLLISARNTCAVYKVDRSTGAIRWRLGGRHSDFALGPGAAFAWQHDARRQEDGTLTIFDDERSPTPARAIALRLDETAMTATLEREYRHPTPLLVGSQGNLQHLPDGHVFIGWGSAGAYTEFDPGGGIVEDASFPGSKQSYRCFRFPWLGRPSERPALAIVPAGAGASTAYGSWNGSTEVATWELLAGPRETDLRRVGRERRSGFETAIGTTDPGPWFALRAVDGLGQVIGISKPLNRAT